MRDKRGWDGRWGLLIREVLEPLTSAHIYRDRSLNLSVIASSALIPKLVAAEGGMAFSSHQDHLSSFGIGQDP